MGKAFSIKTKLILLFLFSSLIPIMTLGLFSYNSAVKSLKEEYSSAVAVSLNRISADVDIIIQQLYDYAEVISRDNIIIGTGLGTDLDSADRNARNAAMNLAMSEMNYLGRSVSVPVKAVAVFENGNYLCNFVSSREEMERVVKTIKSDDWYDDYSAYDNSTHFIGVSKDRYFGAGEFYHFYFARNLFNDRMEYVGKLMLDVNAYSFDRLLSSFNINGNTSYFLLDKNMSLLALSTEYGKENAMDFGYLKESLAESSGSFRDDSPGNNRIISYNRLKYGGWVLAGITNEAQIFKGIRGISLLTVLLMLALIFFEIIIYIIVNKTITSPILKLSREMRKVESGSFDVNLTPRTRDEVGELTLGFNKMVARISKLIENIIREQKMAKEFEFSMLQAQINPHFLYNSLNSIKQMAELNNSASISFAISSLVNLLRYSISHKSELIPLKNEIKYIESYIHLNNIRYNNKFSLKCSIPENLLDAEILKFTLQPLVENSILHGFKVKKGIGAITISAWEATGHFIIFVSDNGEGMPEEKIREIKQDDILDKKKGFTHIGLSSVDKRIKLTYGDDYGIKIESELSRGTTIYLLLPPDLKLKEPVKA